MKDEALKLALEALEKFGRGETDGMPLTVLVNHLRESLAQPAPPPECKTKAEQTAFAFGWWKALESVRAEQVAQEYHRGYADAMNWKVQNHLEHLPPKEPAQELPPLTDADRRSYQKGHDAGVAHHKQAIGQRNFCHRCGKRLQGVLGQPQSHTCTPPLWGHK